MFKKTREKSPYYHLAMDFGYTLLAGVVLFGYGGYRIDQKYPRFKPLFLIGGVLLGLATGFNSLFRRLKLLEQKDKATKQGKEPKEPKQ